MKLVIEINLPEGGVIDGHYDVGRTLTRLANVISADGIEVVNCTAVRDIAGNEVGEVYLDQGEA